jgi:hypothetical protein
MLRRGRSACPVWLTRPRGPRRTASEAGDTWSDTVTPTDGESVAEPRGQTIERNSLGHRLTTLRGSAIQRQSKAKEIIGTAVIGPIPHRPHHSLLFSLSLSLPLSPCHGIQFSISSPLSSRGCHPGS